MSIKERIIKWGVKKYVLSITNTALAQHAESIAKARATVARYAAKVSAVLRYLDSLNAKLADNIITADESDALCNEAIDLGKELAQ